MKRIIVCGLGALTVLCSVFSCGRSGKDDYSGKETVATILARKSVRNFSGRPVEKEKADLLLRAAMAAPTGKDTRPWEMVVVDERNLLDTMAARLPYAKMLAEAPMAIVVCGDTTRSFYWYLDCAAAAENILLAAEALGLGAVWTAAYPYERRMAAVAECLGLPGHIRPLNVIPVGYPAGRQKAKDKFDERKIHYNRW